jgi:hypothetical protein
MNKVQALLQHLIFEVSIVQCVTQIPADTEQNNVVLEVAPFEWILNFACS